MKASFFFNDTATTEIYTLSLHDALPICVAIVHDPNSRRRYDALRQRGHSYGRALRTVADRLLGVACVLLRRQVLRSEEHTSELQSRQYLVCRLLLEKKKELSLISAEHSP